MADEWSTLDAFWLLRDDRSLSNGDRRVAIALVMFSDEAGACWPSIAKLATTARTSPGAVRRSLKHMQAGVGPIDITVERRKSTSGDDDTHRYVLRLRRVDQADRTPDQADPTPDHPDRTVGSPRPHRGITQTVEGGSPRPTKRISEEEREEDTEGDKSSASQSSAAPLALTHPTSKAKQAARRKTKQTETSDPRVTELRDFYVSTYKATKGAEPVLTPRQWPRAMGAFKELLVAAKELQLAKSIIRKAFADEWQRERQCQPWEIVAAANKFVGVGRRAAAPVQVEQDGTVSQVSSYGDVLARLGRKVRAGDLIPFMNERVRQIQADEDAAEEAANGEEAAE
jgi:hypothetical protein